MARIDEAWLAQIHEEALEPELPICDPHHHLWDYPGSRYLLDELERDVRAHRVRSSVFVECGSGYRTEGPLALRPVGETEYVERLLSSRRDPASAFDACAGIVGHADLMLGAAVDEVLAAHQEASPRFRGIRHAAAWHESDAIRESHSRPPPHLFTLPAFREGFARLRAHDLVFDAWIFHTQLAELSELAHAFDDQIIVLDHMGGPLGIGPYAGRRAEVLTEWRVAIDRLARCENVVVKLGGLQMAINGFAWHKRPRPPTSAELAEAAAPYTLHCLERFGLDRCMFEGNFPVDKVSCSHAVLYNAFKLLVADLSEPEKTALFHDNAARIYRLG